MAFCPNCGTEVGGQFCPKCGTNVGTASLGGPAPVASSSTGMSTNLASALCYFLPVAIIFLLIEPYNKNREVRFHAWQCIALSVIWIVFRIVIGIILGGLSAVSFGLTAMVGLLLMLLGLGVFVLYVFLAIKAYNNQRIVLPVIGQWAEKQA